MFPAVMSQSNGGKSALKNISAVRDVAPESAKQFSRRQQLREKASHNMEAIEYCGKLCQVKWQKP
jgi:hypothetical protein